MTKIFAIKGKDEFDLVKKVNLELAKGKYFASPIVVKPNGEFVCFLYSEETQSKKDELATEKQIKYLQSLNIDIPEDGITIREASKLIEENK